MGKSNDKTAAAGSVKRHAILVFVGFALVVGILVFVTMRGIKSLGTVTDHLREVVEVNHAKVSLMTKMHEVIRERMLKVYKITNLDDPFLIEEEWEKYSAYASQFIKTREDLLNLGLTEKQKGQIDEQKSLLRESGKNLDLIVKLSREGEKFNINDLLLDALEANKRVMAELDEMRNYQAFLARESVEEARAEYQEARTEIIFLAGFGVWLCLLIIFFIVRRIRTQAAALTDVLGQLAEANENLEFRVEERTNELMAARTENMRMSAELQVTQRLQSMLLPKDEELLAIKNLDIAGFMEPADEVGGDYYDVLRSGQRTMFSIGDVTGHGLESGVLMLMVQSAVRTLLAAGIKEPKFFMQALNRTVHDNAKRLQTDKNMTLSLVCACDRVLQICGQHEDVLVVRKNGEIEQVDTSDLGFPLGILPDIDEFVAQTHVELNPGDGFVLYTDGITEAFGEGREMYGIERLCRVISQNWEYSAAEIKQAIVNDVRSFLVKQFDDLTLVVVKQK